MMQNIGKMIEQQQQQPLGGSGGSGEQTVDSPDSSAHAHAVITTSGGATTVTGGNGETHTQIVRMRLVPRGSVTAATAAVVERRMVKQEDSEAAAAAAGPLSVIVQPQEESRESELLSPGKLSPASAATVNNIMDNAAGDYRQLNPEPTYQTLTSVNGRMSPPGYSPNSSYATLTPLQPLPPISTMSDKFAYGGHTGNVSGTFTVMQNNSMSGIGLGIGVTNVNTSTPYTMTNIGMTPPHSYSSPGMGMQQQSSPISPQSTYSQNGLPSPQKSMSPPGYDSPYGNQRDMVPRLHSPNLSPPSGSLNSPDGTLVTTFSSANLNGLGLQNHPPALVQIAAPQRDCSPSPPVVTLQTATSISHQAQQQNQQQQGMISGKASSQGTLSVPAIAADVEEINTKELAQRISAELKRYSIPQAIFAQRVLCRSQGTLSDLLRNPKPWSKLKSGRETFRRMWKWLQEPEFQRMSALRLADCEMRNVNVRAVNSKRRKSSTSSCFCTDTPARQYQFFADDTVNYMEDADGESLMYNMNSDDWMRGCKRKEDPSNTSDQLPTPKKPRLVFTDLQRRTLQAIFKETKRPSKEMQVTIARQLGLEPTTVGNFFMNARRRSMDKWKDEDPKNQSQTMLHQQMSPGMDQDDMDQDGDIDNDMEEHEDCL